MQNMALAMELYRQQKQTVERPRFDGPTVTAEDPPTEAGPGGFSRGEGRRRQIVYLDTLAADVAEALELLRGAGWLPPRPAGGYVRLGDIGETLAMIDRSGLLPLAEPDWYLRLQAFARPSL